MVRDEILEIAFVLFVYLNVFIGAMIIYFRKGTSKSSQDPKQKKVS